MNVWRDTLDRWLTAQTVGIFLLTFSVMTGVAGYVQQHPDGFSLTDFLADYYANVSTEAASIAVTVLIIDALNRRREERSSEVREREHLIHQLGSTVNEVARRAVEELRARGWLTDGSVQECDLQAANLEDARLWKADLQGVNMKWARLKDANLNGANLVGATLVQTNLWNAKLNGADLRGVNLREAKMWGARLHHASLRDADLTGADLERAILTNADLTGATLDGTIFNDRTILPDGANWTPDADLARFTDAHHPDHFVPEPAPPPTDTGEMRAVAGKTLSRVGERPKDGQS